MIPICLIDSTLLLGDPFVLATGLRRGELQTLHWSDLDLAHRRVHVRAKPQYAFLPKDWEERTVPFSKELAEILKKHSRTGNCPLVFPSPVYLGHLSSPSFLHDLCKAVAKRAGLDEKEWHLHRFRDTAATDARRTTELFQIPLGGGLPNGPTF